MDKNTEKFLLRDYRVRNRFELKQLGRPLNFTFEECKKKAELEGYEELLNNSVIKTSRFRVRLTKIDKYGNNNIDNFTFCTNKQQSRLNQKEYTCRCCKQLLNKDNFLHNRNSYRKTTYMCKDCYKKLSV